MNTFIGSIAILGALLGSNVQACSFGGGGGLFKPTLERWEQHEGPRSKDPRAEGDYWEKVPAPIVSVLKVTRGTTSPGSSCNDAGTITLEISLPEDSTYDIKEFGFYFRVISGKLPDEIFPDIPLIGEINNGKVNLFFAWLDGHPKYQFPLDLEIEVFLITNGLNIGKSSKFRVTSEIGKG
jgi:hypothetical protein